MASPLFRIHIVNLAGWKTGSRETVGLKMAVGKDKKRERQLCSTGHDATKEGVGCF
jgi:hypothetical protein